MVPNLDNGALVSVENVMVVQIAKYEKVLRATLEDVDGDQCLFVAFSGMTLLGRKMELGVCAWIDNLKLLCCCNHPPCSPMSLPFTVPQAPMLLVLLLCLTC